MASMEDLFGPEQIKRDPSPKWLSPGDTHDAFVSGESMVEDDLSYPGRERQYIELQEDGKWKPKLASELAWEGTDRMLLTKIVVPVTLLTGEKATFYFSSKTEKAALRAAMASSGLGLTPGTGIRKQRGENIGRSYTWTIKLAAPKV